MLRLTTVFALAIATPAAAAEVGDVVFLSKGAGLTITSVRRINRETVAMTGNSMEANASEYCERYDQLTTDSPKWKGCLRDNVSDRATTITVNCRTATIVLTGAFAKLKTLLRKAAERTIDGLWTTIGRSLDLFTPQECANYFAAAGYEP